MSGRTKKRSASFVDDSDDSSAAKQSAPKKTKSTASTAKAGTAGTDDEGNAFWEVSTRHSYMINTAEANTLELQLSQKRRVGVSQFKNMSFVNIREYYEKDGKTLPGKKVSQLSHGVSLDLHPPLLSARLLTSILQGISLSVEQYTSFLKVIPELNAALRELGHDIDDPVTSASNGPSSSVAKKPKKEKPAKANIEATSEEDN